MLVPLLKSCLPMTWQTESFGNLSMNFINRKTQLYSRFLNSILNFTLSFSILIFAFSIIKRLRPYGATSLNPGILALPVENTWVLLLATDPPV